MNTAANQTNSEQDWPQSVGLFYQQRFTRFTQRVVDELTTLMDVQLVGTFSQLLIMMIPLVGKLRQPCAIPNLTGL